MAAVRFSNVGGWWLSLRSPRRTLAGASQAQPPATRSATGVASYKNPKTSLAPPFAFRLGIAYSRPLNLGLSDFLAARRSLSRDCFARWLVCLLHWLVFASRLPGQVGRGGQAGGRALRLHDKSPRRESLQ